MARCRAAILALAALLAAAAAPSVVLAQGTFEAMQDTTFSQLAPMAGQWNISVEATRSPDRAFVPQVCPDDVYAAPCNQPPLNADAKDKLRVTATLKAEPLRTVGDLEPERIWVKACYAKSSLVDRPWRKANDNIDVSGPLIFRVCALRQTNAALCDVLCGDTQRDGLHSRTHTGSCGCA
jgi:High-affinity nitrate transporter accessory